MKKLSLILLCIMLCSCSNKEVPADTAPMVLNVQYIFNKDLTKEEADKYIQGVESIGKVTSMVSDNLMPIDNFSANFLYEGTELYMVEEGVVAIYDDGETYYAVLLIVNTDTE